MRKFLLLVVLGLFVGCSDDTYLYNEGDRVIISEKIMLHPNYKERTMKKYIGETVTITSRWTNNGNVYRVAEDGGSNYWAEAFLELVERGMISKQKQVRRSSAGVLLFTGIVETTTKAAQEIKEVYNEAMAKPTRSMETEVKEVNVIDADTIESYYLPRRKVYWFWKLYEKAQEDGNHSDWFQVWEYVEKYIPEVKAGGFYIDDSASRPRFWRKKQ